MARSDSAYANDISIVQAFHERVGFEFTRQRMGFVAIKFRVKCCAFAKSMRLFRQRCIEENTEQRALHIGLIKRFQYPYRIAAPTATGIVCHIGKQ